MNLEHLQRNWDALGAEDPFWAVLTAPGKKGGRWTVAEFLAEGRHEIDTLMDDLSRICPVARRRTALDFGCGAGRLTQALTRYFDHVVGVDIAPSMIDKAQVINAEGLKCEFLLNARPDLSLLAGRRFDLIYSNLVLQHMAPTYIRAYVEDFITLLSHEGVAVFHVPAPVRWQSVKAGLPEMVLRPIRWLRGRRGPVMQMYGLDPGDVGAVVRSGGGAVVAMNPSYEGGPRFPGTRYVARRRL